MSLAAHVNPIHTSGSATSLQHLADTGCIFCGESQEEKGEDLLEIKPPCKCTFSAHASCWESQESRLCPSCKKVTLPKQIVLEDETVKTGMTRKTAVCIFIMMAAILAFVIGLTMSFRKN